MPVPEEIEFRALAKHQKQIEAAAKELAKLSNDQQALLNYSNSLKALINEVYDALDERITALERKDLPFGTSG